MSHDVVNFAVPVGLNWNEHSAGSANTTTGEFACACSRPGLTYEVSALYSGMKKTIPSASPIMNIGFRPTRSVIVATK